MNNNKINKIQSLVNIVNIIGEIITLNNKGNNFVGLCPFHTDNSPSLVVSEKKQIYKCFVCNQGGNVFDFIKHYYNLSFLDSVRRIVEIANLNIKIETSTNEKIRNKLFENKTIKINELSNFFFQHNLLNNNNSFKDYLINERKLNIDIINKYQIGSTSENGNLKSFLESHNFSDSDILNSKLIFVDEKNNKFQDFFNKRIIFPIKNEFDLTVGFSGRTISQNVKSKYINSKESQIFQKHELLYNMYNAKNSKSLIDKKSIFIVEGFMDVIALDIIGYDNVVAVMGLSLSNIQIQKLKSLSQKVVLFLDNDAAGNNTNFKFIDLLVKNNFQVKIINNKNQKDAFDIWRYEGKHKLSLTIENQSIWWEFKYKYLKNLNNENVIDLILKLYQSIGKEVQKMNFLKFLKNDDQFLYNQIDSLINKKPLEKEIQIIDYNWELLKKMITSKYFTLKYSQEIFYIPNKKMNILASYIVKYYNRYEYLKIKTITDYFNNEITDLSLKKLAFQLLREVNLYFDNLINSIVDNIKSSVIKKLKKEILNEKNIDLKKEKILNLTKIIKLEK